MKKMNLSLLALLVISAMFVGCAKYGPVVKMLDQYNNETSRYWKAFIKENGIDALNNQGNSIMSTAIESNSIDLVKAVLKCKIKPNRYVQSRTSFVGTDYGLTALGVAVSQSKIDPAIIEALLKNGDSPVEYKENGELRMDVLSWAVRNNNLDAIGIVLPYYKKNMLDYSKITDEETLAAFYFIKHMYDDEQETAERIRILKTLFDKGYRPSSYDFTTIIIAYINPIGDNDAQILKPIIDSLVKSGNYKNMPISRDNLDRFFLPDDVVLDRLISLLPELLDAGVLVIPDNYYDYKNLNRQKRGLFDAVYHGTRYWTSEGVEAYYAILSKYINDLDSLTYNDFVREQKAKEQQELAFAFSEIARELNNRYSRNQSIEAVERFVAERLKSSVSRIGVDYNESMLQRFFSEYTPSGQRK